MEKMDLVGLLGAEIRSPVRSPAACASEPASPWLVLDPEIC